MRQQTSKIAWKGRVVRPVPAPIRPARHRAGVRRARYTLDLILPVIDFGQQSAFHPRGASVWLAYALIATGLLLVTTVAAAGARRLRRA